jgi:hypothetical protein
MLKQNGTALPEVMPLLTPTRYPPTDAISKHPGLCESNPTALCIHTE